MITYRICDNLLFINNTLSIDAFFKRKNPGSLEQNDLREIIELRVTIVVGLDVVEIGSSWYGITMQFVHLKRENKWWLKWEKQEDWKLQCSDSCWFRIHVLFYHNSAILLYSAYYTIHVNSWWWHKVTSAVYLFKRIKEKNQGRVYFLLIIQEVSSTRKNLCFCFLWRFFYHNVISSSRYIH